MSRKAGWRKPEHVTYVGRPSRWGNPFVVSEFGIEVAVGLYDDMVRGFWNPGRVADLSDEVVTAIYETRSAWLARIGRHPMDVAVSELAGRDLACWCPLSAPCHADSLLAVANR